MTQHTLPELLAPAGDMSCFLAGMAAGADATYVGLKNFSARAGAENFSTTELARMVDLGLLTSDASIHGIFMNLTEIGRYIA